MAQGIQSQACLPVPAPSENARRCRQGRWKMEGKFEWLKTSPERIETVIEEISYGSEPKISFYALLATASLIAAFGLIANSTAVIIGAMLVSPLMTPIIGISLALVRGNTALLGRAIRAEVLGVVLAVGIAAILGLFPLALQVTPEMLARTEPNLLDLLVAVLAGFAGTYALIDARLSPALPGVAIATAIVPPLSNSGLCLAMGAFSGAWGSFLLFFANFLAILLVSSATFIAAGMAPKIHWADRWDLARRFGVAAVGFIIVTALLTHTLVKIVSDRYLNNAIKTKIEAEFSQFPSTSLVSTIHQEYQGKLYILATVRTPKIIDPDRVKLIQDALTQQLDLPTELIVRAILAKDVSATGSTSQVTAQNLDGFFLGGKLSPDVLKVQEAEQVLREILAARPELQLVEVGLLHFPRGPVILATIQGSRVLIPEEIKKFEKAIQDRLQAPDLHLVTRCLTTVDVDAEGHILYGWAHFGSQSPEELALQDRAEQVVRAEFKKISSVFVTNVDVIRKDDVWSVRVEAVGTKAISPRELERIEEAVSDRLKKPAKIYLWFKGEVMITDQGYSSVEEFTRKRLAEEAAQARPGKPASMAEQE
jgi:uncharacterized hydrophobic protein (TIGR00271 family)